MKIVLSYTALIALFVAFMIWPDSAPIRNVATLAAYLMLGVTAAFAVAQTSLSNDLRSGDPKKRESASKKIGAVPAGRAIARALVLTTLVLMAANGFVCTATMCLGFWGYAMALTKSCRDELKAQAAS